MVISWTLQHSIPSRAQFIPKKLNSGGQPSNHKICLIKMNKNRAQNDYEIPKLRQKNLKLPRHASISSVVFNESSLLEIFYCVCVGQRENGCLVPLWLANKIPLSTKPISSTRTKPQQSVTACIFGQNRMFKSVLIWHGDVRHLIKIYAKLLAHLTFNCQQTSKAPNKE